MTPEDPRMSNNTAEIPEHKKQQLKLQITKQETKLGPDHTNRNIKLYIGSIIDFDARKVGVHLKESIRIKLITKHADCHIIFILYPICL